MFQDIAGNDLQDIGESVLQDDDPEIKEGKAPENAEDQAKVVETDPPKDPGMGTGPPNPLIPRADSQMREDSQESEDEAYPFPNPGFRLHVPEAPYSREDTFSILQGLEMGWRGWALCVEPRLDNPFEKKNTLKT